MYEGGVIKSEKEVVLVVVVVVVQQRVESHQLVWGPPLSVTFFYFLTTRLS